jgi:hypothetical protein
MTLYNLFSPTEALRRGTRTRIQPTRFQDYQYSEILVRTSRARTTSIGPRINASRSSPRVLGAQTRSGSKRAAAAGDTEEGASEVCDAERDGGGNLDNLPAACQNEYVSQTNRSSVATIAAVEEVAGDTPAIIKPVSTTRAVARLDRKMRRLMRPGRYPQTDTERALPGYFSYMYQSRL